MIEAAKTSAVETKVEIAAAKAAIVAVADDGDVVVDAVAADAPPAQEVRLAVATCRHQNTPRLQSGDQQRSGESRGGYDQRGQQPRGFEPRGQQPRGFDNRRPETGSRPVGPAESNTEDEIILPGESLAKYRNKPVAAAHRADRRTRGTRAAARYRRAPAALSNDSTHRIAVRPERPTAFLWRACRDGSSPKPAPKRNPRRTQRKHQVPLPKLPFPRSRKPPRHATPKAFALRIPSAKKMSTPFL